MYFMWSEHNIEWSHLLFTFGRCFYPNNLNFIQGIRFSSSLHSLFIPDLTVVARIRFKVLMLAYKLEQHLFTSNLQAS